MISYLLEEPNSPCSMKYVFVETLQRPLWENQVALMVGLKPQMKTFAVFSAEDFKAKIELNIYVFVCWLSVGG